MCTGYTCAEARGGHPLSSCFISLKQGLSWNPELEIFHLGGPQAPVLLLRPSSSVRITFFFGLDFHTDVCDLNSGPRAWTARAHTHWAVPPAPYFLITFINLTSGAYQFILAQGDFWEYLTNDYFHSIFCLSEGCLCNCRKLAHGNVSCQHRMPGQLKLTRELHHISPQVVWSCYFYLWKLIK